MSDFQEYGLFIGGEFVQSTSGATFALHSPHDDQIFGTVAEAGVDDVENAIAAARTAFEGPWGALSPKARGKLLLRLARLIEDQGESIARLESKNSGHPIRDVRRFDLVRAVDWFEYFAGMATKIQGDTIPSSFEGVLNYTVREPLGVIGQIVPWNFPLMFVAWNIAPVLAAGNTVVLKPAEYTPLSALEIARLTVEAGFPPGAVNVVPGKGSVAGAALARHKGVDKICFTGSVEVGQQILRDGAVNLKRPLLELGGKGPNIIFDDADLESAVQGSLFAAFHNQGQACIAGSRILLHETIWDRFMAAFLPRVRALRVGNPLDEATQMGPLTSRDHQLRVLAYVDVATAEGGEILCGGKRPDDPETARGYYVLPTLVRAENPKMRVCQEEVFGPFITVTPFKSEEEALAIANGVPYGLGAGLWTRNLRRAHGLAARLRAGMVWINSYKLVDPASPFGGTKMSGVGREMGFETMRECTQVKSVWVGYDFKPWRWPE
ncbi:MAG: aldehyde dehydrogenase family protein [Thermoplasmata archaeon]|nr:aldehyde dehydrogenase family protein [Thermoplasmata archaeon]